MGSPRHVLAPMVDASELAWRIFSRSPVAGIKGKDKEEQTVELASSESIPLAAELCYTPMISAKFFGDLDIKNNKLRSAFDLVTGKFLLCFVSRTSRRLRLTETAFSLLSIPLLQPTRDPEIFSLVSESRIDR